MTALLAGLLLLGAPQQGDPQQGDPELRGFRKAFLERFTQRLRREDEGRRNVNVAAARERRRRLAALRRAQNEKARLAVAQAKPDRVVPLPQNPRVKAVLTYAATVTIPLRKDDRDAPAQGVKMVATVRERRKEPRQLPCESTEEGCVLRGIELPAQVDLNVADPNGEWRLRAEDPEEDPAKSGEREGETFPLVIPPSDTAPPRPAEKVRNGPLNAYRRLCSLKVDRPVVVRRRLVDFRLPKSSVPAHVRAATLSVTLGQETRPVTSAGDAWSFQAPRDDLPEAGPVRFVAEFQTPNAQFGGELRVAAVEPYATNAPAPLEVRLEAIPEGALKIDEHAVWHEFPLSPLCWLGATDPFPVRVTGKDAINLLGSDTLNEWPDPPPNERNWIWVPKDEPGRYGAWVVLGEQGLRLHYRWDPDKDAETKGLQAGWKFLPLRDKRGIVDAVRVTEKSRRAEGGSAEGGGRIGEALFVGAAEADVRTAFGGFDPPRRRDDALLGFGEDDAPRRNQALYGDRRIVEAWDDSILGGGVRIKWDRNRRVAWFEIVRPVQMLYDGVRTYQPPRAPRAWVRAVAFRDPDKPGSEAEGRTRIRGLLQACSGLLVVDDEREADYALDVVFNAGGRRIKEGGFRIKATRTRDPDPLDPLFDVIPAGVRAYSADENDPAAFAKRVTEEGEIQGNVIGVNYQTRNVLVDLGGRHGIRDKGESVTEFAVYLLYEVNPKTGETSNNSYIDNQAIVGGKNSDEWLEVQKLAGDDRCLAKFKRKGPGNRTVDADGALQRLIDPGSGLVRVRIVPKRRRGA